MQSRSLRTCVMHETSEPALSPVISITILWAVIRHCHGHRTAGYRKAAFGCIWNSVQDPSTFSLEEIFNGKHSCCFDSFPQSLFDFFKIDTTTALQRIWADIRSLRFGISPRRFRPFMQKPPQTPRLRWFLHTSAKPFLPVTK